MDKEDDSTTGSTVVEQQNQQNLHDEQVLAALDAVMMNSEQSYPHFVENFTQLNNDNVKVPNLNLSSQESRDPIDFDIPELPDSSPSLDTHNLSSQNPCVANGDNTAPPVGTNEQRNLEDVLEEEVIGVGERPPSVLLRESSYTGNAVKLDNFLDNNDSDSDDSVPLEEGEWIELGGYQASFSPRSQVNNTTVSAEDKTPNMLLKRDSTGAIITDDVVDNQSESSRPASVEPLVDRFPGEIEDVPISPRENEIRNVRRLDMSTTKVMSADNQKSNQIQSQESSGDDVQPFCLDADFDYDNVVLSSKFSPMKSNPAPMLVTTD